MIIQIFDDFDLDKIAGSGQCFRWTKKDEHTYRIIAGKACLYISGPDHGRYNLECGEEEYAGFWEDYFDLKEDYRAIRGQIDPEQDPFLWQAAEREKGIRILRQDPWEMLITFIISQNRNIPAIRRSVELLAESCGEAEIDSRGAGYYAFPEPDALAALSENDLLACKLGYRWKYVRAAADAVSEGALDLDNLASADAQSAMTALTALFGVGVKVASCVSLFGLHHTDAFPVDVWMKRVLAQEYPEGYPYAKYSPYNGIFQQYMFACYRDAAFHHERSSQRIT
ncbi:MAG: DNA glycosylase [Eubacteriales bacterium]|nr:DNA glycosylase [Eubacteriales bacterium]